MNWYRCALRRVGLPISGWTLALAGLACALAAPRALASDGRLRGVSDCNGNGVADASDLGVWTPRVNVSAADGAADDLFGAALALDGDTMVVGALDDDDAGFSAGSAYVYVRSGLGWVQQAKLIASDAAASDLFGWSVSVHGDTAVVGAPFADQPGKANAGAAYVFVRSDGVWTQQAKLTASDSAAGDQFGVSVSISGNSVLVGARMDDHAGGIDAGSAYVFVQSGGVWTQDGKLVATDGAAGDLFGFSVAIHNEVMMLGAPNNDHAGGAEAGALYLFGRDLGGSGWIQRSKQTASDAAAGDGFGSTVAIYNETAVVGAPGDDDGGGGAGAAYVFTMNGGLWTQHTKLTASDAASNDLFGYSVSIHGSLAVVGAIFDDHVGGVDAGSAYVFDRSSGVWTQLTKLTAPGAAASDGLGTIVAISGDTVLAGVYLDDHTGGTNAGSVQTFGIGRDCDGDTVPDECALAADPGLDCNDDGIPDDCQIDTWAERAKLTAGIWDDFWVGYSVDLQGDLAVLGTPGGGNGGGSAYVFERIAGVWTEQAELTTPDAAHDADMGHSASLFGDTAILGAPKDDVAELFEAGSAYVFVRSGGEWTQQARLLAPDGMDLDSFGYAVSISGDTAVVGAYGDDTGVGLTLREDSGSAYVFVRSGGSWSLETQLLASDRGTGDALGWSVSIDGDTAVVGAYREDRSMLTDAGAAYVFVRNGGVWTQQAKLIASDAASEDWFGWSVSIDGDTVIVGAIGSYYAGRGGGGGAAYVFVRSAGVWTQQGKLIHADALTLGHSVSVSGDVALVGSSVDSYAGLTNAGTSHVFRRSGGVWSHESMLTASDAGRTDRFGASVSIDGETALVGAFFDDHGFFPVGGSAYIFTVRRDCDSDGALDECEADCDGDEVPDDCDDPCGGACCIDPPGVGGDTCSEVADEAACRPFVCNAADHLPGTFVGCYGDADGNGIVNAGDRGAVTANIGQTDPALLCVNDLDGNGVINAADRGVVSANINRCVALPDYQNGSGLNGGSPDTRFGAAEFHGPGTTCAQVSCP